MSIFMNQIHNAIGSTGGYASGGSGNQNSNNMSGIVGAGISMLGGLLGARNQHRRQRQLMGVQYQNQRLLNQQGHDLQYDMWNKTNYGAQVKHMKDAGLNPALMYGSAGQGGTTGSQGGGSAASGNAAAFNAMDLSNMMLMKAQAEDLKAGARLKNVEADKKAGVDTDLTEASIKEIIQNTTNKGLEAKLISLQTDITDIQKSFKKRELEANVGKTEAELRRLKIAGDLDAEIFNASVREAVANSFKAQAENRLFEAKEVLTDAQSNQIYNQIQQDWAKIDISEGMLDETSRGNTIKEFQQDLDLKLTEMNIDKDLKVAILRSLTSIFTTLISGVSNMASAGMDRRTYNYRTEF